MIGVGTGMVLYHLFLSGWLIETIDGITGST